MDVVNVERDFTAWLATQLTLTVDTTIFRGGIPEGYNNAVGVVFGAKMQTRTFYGFRPQKWHVQICGKFDDRDTANQFVSTLSALFPIQEFQHGGTQFLSAYPDAESVEPYEADDNGKVKSFVSYNIGLAVLTSESVSETVTGSTQSSNIGD